MLVDVLMRVRMAVASSIRVLVLVRVGVLVRVLVHAFLLGGLVLGFRICRAQGPSALLDPERLDLIAADRGRCAGSTIS